MRSGSTSLCILNTPVRPTSSPASATGKMASQGQRSHAHRPSVSRIVPAIPHALVPKNRRQHQEGKTVVNGAAALPARSTMQAKPATPPTETDATDNASALHGKTSNTTSVVHPNGLATPPAELSNQQTEGVPARSRTSSAAVNGSFSEQSGTATSNTASDSLEKAIAITPTPKTSVELPEGAVRRLSVLSNSSKINFGAQVNGSGGTAVSQRPRSPSSSSGPRPPSSSGPRPEAAPFIPGVVAYDPAAVLQKRSVQPPPGLQTLPGNQDFRSLDGVQGAPAQPMPDRYVHAVRGSSDPYFQPRAPHGYGREQNIGAVTPTSMAGIDGSSRAHIPTAPPVMATPYESPWIANQVRSAQVISTSSMPPPPPPPPFSRGFNAEFDPSAASLLAGTIHSQFGVTDFADCTLHVLHAAQAFNLAPIPGHSIVLARSPKLRSLMTMQAPHSGAHGRVLTANVSDRFVGHEQAFVKALMRLYGEEIPSPGFVMQTTAYANPNMVHSERMFFALSYAATGHFLQVDEIVGGGLDLADRFLVWENIEKALAFGLDGGLGASWSQREAGSEDRDSASSFDDAHSKVDSPSAAPTYGFYSDRLLCRVLDWAAASCPADFKFFAAAPQLHDVPRLPLTTAAEQSHARSKSSLSRIRFGEMSANEDVSPSLPVLMLSSVLVSLPFYVLKYLLEHPLVNQRLGAERTGLMMQAVVAEREQRRQRVTLGGPAGIDLANDLLAQASRWSETIEASSHHPSGFRITRHKVGAHTPTSMTSTKT